MKDLVRYRAMESLCRQNAVFHPLDSWCLLAEAEMWHHKAEDAIASLSVPGGATPSAGARARAESQADASGASRPLAR